MKETVVEAPAQEPEDIVATAAEETPEEPAKVEEEVPRRRGRTPYTPKPRSKRGKQEDKEVGCCFCLFPRCTDTNQS